MALLNNNLKILWPQQVPFFMRNGVFFDDEFKVSRKIIIVHRRGGKSIGCAIKDHYKVREFLAEKEIYKIKGHVDSSYPSIAFLAPTKFQARQIIWDKYKQYMAGFPGVKFNNSQLKITVPRPLLGDHITLELMASKNHDRIRGLKYREVNVDETQDATEEAIDGSIVPTLADSRGLCNFFGTAKGQDHFHSMSVRAIGSGQPVFYFPATHTSVYTPEELLEMKAKMADGQFEREYLLDFTAKIPGTFFHSTIEQMKTQPWFFDSEADEKLPCIMGVDIGVGEGFAAWTARVDFANNIINIQDFYTGYDTLDVLRRDVSEDGCFPDTILLPHDGNTRQMGTTKKITTKKSFKEVFWDSRVYVNGKTMNLMNDITRINDNLHLLRFPDRKAAGTDAHRGLQMLSEFSRKQDPNTGAYMDAIDKGRGVDHAADAMRTLFTGLNVTEGIIRRDFPYRRDERFEIRRGNKVYEPWNARISNSGFNIASSGAWG